MKGKIQQLFACFLIGIAISHAAMAQGNRVVQDSIWHRYAQATVALNNLQPGYYIVRLNESGCTLPNGMAVVRSVNEFVKIVSVTVGVTVANTSSRISCIGKIAIANPEWKLSPAIDQVANKKFRQQTRKQLFVITTADIVQFIKSYCTGSKARVIQVYTATQSAVISCSPAYLFSTILPAPGTTFVDEYLSPQTEILLNGYNKRYNGMNHAAIAYPFAKGTGIVLGVKERRMESTDIDLQSRITSSPIAAPDVETHATTIATLAGGAGNSFYTSKGIAWACQFFSSSFSNIFPDSTALLLQKLVFVQNHSYGTSKQHFYGAEAAAYDAQTWSNKSLMHIFSSGNRGTEAATTGTYNGINGFANMTGNFKMAKNVITVAALDTAGTIAPFSSTGPLHDGRMAPQVAALGFNGTSDAAALVSGTAAVLHQVYKDSNAAAIPAASLIKAILFNTADDVAAPGIDYRSGFGSINTHSAITALLRRQYDGATLAQGQLWTKNISLPAQATNLKITLVWTDSAASINNNKALINDLDIELVEQGSGTVYRPWCLSTAPFADSLNFPARRRRDSLNTAEQISIALPNAGAYQIRVSGTVVQTSGTQPFHIAWGWDTLNTFLFTNPLQANDAVATIGEPLTVQWKSIPAAINATGALAVSYNNGSSWQTVASNVPLAKQQYKWLVQDTSSTAQLRMTTGFGTFFSPSFILAPVTLLQVDFVCTDSVGISWTPHRYASGYQLYAQAVDTPYLKPVRLVTDTVAVMNRSQYPYTLYAVQPVLSNGLPAVRSYAIDVRQQGVSCYYSSIQAQKITSGVELLVLLSTYKGIDSVVLEKVSGTTVLKRVKAFKVTAPQLEYNTVDASPTPGANHYRGKILLSNGRVAYTDVVTVIDNGNKAIFIYPNPVSIQQQGQFYYQLKQPMLNGRLQLIDMKGREVLSREIGPGGAVAVALLQPGLYVYRLTGTGLDGMETGKIIITK